MRKCERNKPRDTKVSEKVVGEGAAGTGDEIPPQPLEKTVVIQFALCSPWRSTVDHISTLQPMDGPLSEQMGVP